MELSELDPTNSRPNFGAIKGSDVQDELFSKILLGIAAPAQDDEPLDDPDAAPADEEQVSEAEDDSGQPASSPSDDHALAALKGIPDPLQALGASEIATAGMAAQTDISSHPSQSHVTNAGAAGENGENVAGMNAATPDAATLQTATAQMSEEKVLAKREGAIQANQAHGDETKAQLAGAAKNTQAGAKAGAQPQTADIPVHTAAKPADAATPVSDIARLDQAMRQAFAPQAAATPQATTTQSGSDALLTGRSTDTAIDSANAANNNTRANTAATAKAATARPAFNLPNGRPAEQVSVQVQNGIRNGLDRINIKLSPATLGNVEVKLEMAPDKTVQAVVYADKAETLDMLERDGRVLQKALEEAGLRTNSDSLSFEQRGSGDPDNAHADKDANGPDGGRNGDGQTADTDAPELPLQARKSHDGLIDIEA